MNTYPFEYGIDGMPPGFADSSLPDDFAWGILLCWGAALLIIAILYIAIFYRIFKKAGYNGWMGLITLIPGLGILICLGILAFDKWPLLKTSAASLPPVAYPLNYQPTPNYQQQPVVPQPIPAAGYPQPTPPAAYVPVDQAPAQVPVQPPAQVPVQPQTAPSVTPDGGERPFQ